MTEQKLDLEAIKARHEKHGPDCNGFDTCEDCDMVWPCDAYRLADRCEDLESENLNLYNKQIMWQMGWKGQAERERKLYDECEKWKAEWSSYHAMATDARAQARELKAERDSAKQVADQWERLANIAKDELTKALDQRDSAREALENVAILLRGDISTLIRNEIGRVPAYITDALSRLDSALKGRS